MMISCTLALVLLMDVSQSVNHTNYELQREGLAQAFADPQLQQIILSQPDHMVVQVQQFASESEVIINWRMLRTRSDIQAFVQELAQMPRSTPGILTGIGIAMQSAVQAFDHAPCVPEQRVVDVSADGSHNMGVPPSQVRDQAQAHTITINGLPILLEADSDLPTYFREHVVTSDGFVVIAHGYQDFARAIRRKLTLEIATR